jgi:hypothetical protein
MWNRSSGDRYSDQSDAQTPMVHQPRNLQRPQSYRADMVSDQRFPPYRTRYDKLARNFASSVAFTAVVIGWAD